MNLQVELIPITEGNQIVIKENEKVIIGRGSSLGCNDKKISRQHAELILKSDQTLWIKPTHVNPVFYRPQNGKTTSLTKDIEQELKDGDQFGLLPTNFFFRVSFPTDIKHDNETSLSSTDSDSKSRKLPTWMSVKRQLSEEKKEEEETKTDDSKKPSAPKTFDSEDSEDANPPKKVKKSTDKPRPACSYGASCYRKNAAHRAEQSHPGDSDYEDENDKDDDKPECPYGKNCYRQNLQHKREYKH